MVIHFQVLLFWTVSQSCACTIEVFFRVVGCSGETLSRFALQRIPEVFGSLAAFKALSSLKSEHVRNLPEELDTTWLQIWSPLSSSEVEWCLYSVFTLGMCSSLGCGLKRIEEKPLKLANSRGRINMDMPTRRNSFSIMNSSYIDSQIMCKSSHIFLFQMLLVIWITIGLKVSNINWKRCWTMAMPLLGG